MSQWLCNAYTMLFSTSIWTTKDRYLYSLTKLWFRINKHSFIQKKEKEKEKEALRSKQKHPIVADKSLIRIDRIQKDCQFQKANTNEQKKGLYEREESYNYLKLCGQVKLIGRRIEKLKCLIW